MTRAAWSEGYVTDVGYTTGYYPELNPRLATFAMLLAGLEGPPPGPCCELGFGQGLSLAIHAAGDRSRRWWGCDFMPEHAAHAQRLVEAAGVDASISDQSFEAFFARDDLPQFAFIGLHGIWSWVSAANRERIVAFLDRQLLPGGVVYLSHNCMAGWSALMPARALMHAHARRALPPAMPEPTKALDALAFVQRLCDASPQVFAAAPALKGMLGGWATSDPAYLVHELLHDDVQPMDFGQVAARLAAARLEFAASAHLHDRRPELHFSRQQLELLDRIDDRVLREMAQDTLRSRLFRSDYWVRGARRLSRSEAHRRLREQHVVLAMDRADVPLHATGARGTAPLPEPPRGMLLDALELADAPLAIGRILDIAAVRRFDAGMMVDMIATLVEAGALLLAAPPDEGAAARPATQRLNAWLTGAGARPGNSHWLASPVGGGAVGVGTARLLMLAARAEAPEHPERWVASAWAASQAAGRPLRTAGGEPVTDDAGARAVLEPIADALQGPLLRRLRRLGVVD